MDAARWQQLEALFCAALELEPLERAAFLDSACGDDTALREELESMLNVDEDSVAFALESRLLSRDQPDSPDPQRLIGTHIGPYKLEKLIGEGGMGEVYLAQRDDDQYDQKVALKLVRPGHRNVELYRRFRMERQVLARLTHPNITQLLDGGIDNEGRPYLVMQYVEGLPITEFCDKHALSIEERLKLFRTVCAAVQHAHGNLIVHRDLKPSNILVTDDGIVKLLDFGIAKLLDPDWNMSIAVTQSQVRLMTPEYAAPEQVKGNAITTATDVYTLGVLLYEILSGRRPYKLGHRIQSEIERIICEEDPLRPSTALTEPSENTDCASTTTLDHVSQARRTGASRLKKMLKGDLDNIVMMALRKEPERRYASAEQFSLDIERYLTGLPVSAQKDRVGYRFKKFVYRHQTVVATLAAAFIIAIGFGVMMSIQAKKLAFERDRAQMEAVKSQKVAEFLENLFQASDPFEAGSERMDTLRVRDFLAAGVKNVEHELEDQPAIQAALMDVLGSVHLNLGDLHTAEPLLDKSLNIRQEIYQDDHLDVAESLTQKALLLKNKGEYAPAESLLIQSLQMKRRLLGDRNEEVAIGIHNIASIKQDQGDYDTADSLYQNALALRRSLVSPDDWDTATILNDLATVSYLKADLDLADSLFREVLNIRTALRGEEHPDVVGTLTNLSSVLHRKGELEEAKELLNKALALRLKVLGPVHDHTAMGHNNLAALLKTMKIYDEAEYHYRESLSIYQKIYGDEHPDIALVYHNLGAMFKAKQEYDTGADMYKKALAMRLKLLGKNHPSVAATYNNLGTLLKAQRKYQQAEPFLREALAINETLLDADHPRIGLTKDALGDLLLRVGEYKESTEMLASAVAILTKRFGEDHGYTKNAKKSLEEAQAAFTQELASMP